MVTEHPLPAPVPGGTGVGVTRVTQAVTIRPVTSLTASEVAA